MKFKEEPNLHAFMCRTHSTFKPHSLKSLTHFTINPQWNFGYSKYHSSSLSRSGRSYLLCWYSIISGILMSLFTSSSLGPTFPNSSAAKTIIPSELALSAEDRAGAFEGDKSNTFKAFYGWHLILVADLQLLPPLRPPQLRIFWDYSWLWLVWIIV